MQRRVDYYLGEHISQKPRGMDVFSRSSSNGSIAGDGGLFEQPELLSLGCHGENYFAEKFGSF